MGILLFAVVLALFFSFNRLPKLDIVGEDLEAVTAPKVQCFQGFCIEREAGSSFLTRWWSFSVTYLRLVTVGMTFAFVVAGLAEAFLFPSGAGKSFESGGIFKRTLKGAAVGPVMNLCSACIVPVSSAFHKRAGLEGAIAMVQGSATMNIPALAMVFFVFTPLLGFSRLVLAIMGALLIGPIVAMTVRKDRGPSLDIADGTEPEAEEEPHAWGPAMTEAFRDWGKVSVGYLLRMGPIMVVAGFASGLVIQWISPEMINSYLGNDVLGVAVAATLGILINVPLLFEIPLVALLLLLGMGTAPAATLLFTAAAGGPVTFWGLARLMPRRAIATFAGATWALGAAGGVAVLAIGALVWDQGFALRVSPAQAATTEVAEADSPVLPVVPTVEPPQGPLFSDVSAQVGIDFLHRKGVEEQPDTAAGALVLDYNGDGFDDIYVTSWEAPNALFRNNGDGTFTDVAAAAGVYDAGGRGNGGCAADYDNDGHQDLYITNLGKSKLYRNNGDGTFANASKAFGDDHRDGHRSAGCAWGDYDRDGFVDLVVASHLKTWDTMLDDGSYPKQLGGLALYRNDGAGNLTDVTSLLGDVSLPSQSGAVGTLRGAASQPGWVDYDNDGDADLYVVNDLGGSIQRNVLWRNDGPSPDGEWQFTDVSQDSLTNLAMDGKGLAVGDYNRDGHLDLFTTNAGENVLLANNRDGTFRRATSEAGAGNGTLTGGARVSWGAAFLDYDNDGDEDLYVVSGYLSAEQTANPTGQPNALLRNDGDGTFMDVSSVSGADDASIGRAGVYLDYDHDGCLDLFVANLRQRARLYRNECAAGNSWLAINPVGVSSNRDGVGVRITMVAGGKSRIREIAAGSSAMGQNTLWAHFGLGSSTRADYVLIRWPSGAVQTLASVPANQRLVVVEPE